MAFISRQGTSNTFSADAHRLFGDNWWAVDVFFICLETHQQHHTLIFAVCQSIFVFFLIEKDMKEHNWSGGVGFKLK